MFLLADGSVRRMGKQVINPFAQGNGIHNFVIKRSSNVVNVPIESWPH